MSSISNNINQALESGKNLINDINNGPLITTPKFQKVTILPPWTAATVLGDLVLERTGSWFLLGDLVFQGTNSWVFGSTALSAIYSAYQSKQSITETNAESSRINKKIESLNALKKEVESGDANSTSIKKTLHLIEKQISILNIAKSSLTYSKYLDISNIASNLLLTASIGLANPVMLLSGLGGSALSAYLKHRNESAFKTNAPIKEEISNLESALLNVQNSPSNENSSKITSPSSVVAESSERETPSGTVSPTSSDAELDDLTAKKDL